MKFILIITLCIITLFNTSDEDNRIQIAQSNNIAAMTALNAFNDDVHCMAENIIYEAGNQGIRGGIAVAQVTMNRVNDKNYPKTVCGVVKQHKQFSWTNSPKRSKYGIIQYTEARIIALNVIRNKVSLPELKGSLFYHNTSVDPKWNKRMIKVAVIGSHIFYKKAV